jgi:hypothetical protein
MRLIGYIVLIPTLLLLRDNPASWSKSSLARTVIAAWGETVVGTFPVRSSVAGAIYRDDPKVNARLKSDTVCRTTTGRVVDHFNSCAWAGTDMGAWINAASKECGQYCEINIYGGGHIITKLAVLPNTTLRFGPGIFHWVGTQSIDQIQTKISGSGTQITEFDLDSESADLFQVSAQLFQLSDVSIQPKFGVIRKAGYVIAAFSGGGLGAVHDIVLTDPFGGFKHNQNNTNEWVYDKIWIQSAGGHWDSLFNIGNVATGTVTTININNVIGSIAKASSITGPLILLDSGADAISIQQFNAGMSLSTTNTQPVLKLRNTNTSNDPRWVRCVQCYFEAGTAAVGIVIDQALDFSFSDSYVATSLNGVQITGGRGLRFSHSAFVNNKEAAFKIDNSSGHVGSLLIDGNDISDNCFQSDDSFDAISITAVTNEFRIKDNSIGNYILANHNRCRNGITVAAGASDSYSIVGNVINGVANLLVSDGGTGKHKQQFGNPQVAGQVDGSLGVFVDLSSANISAFGSFQIGGRTAISATPPTIVSGFGISSIIATSNGTISFTVNVGGGGSAKSGTIGLPAATNGWNIFCEDTTTFSATTFRTRQIASTNTSATIGNFNSSAAAAPWGVNDILSCSAFAR